MAAELPKVNWRHGSVVLLPSKYINPKGWVTALGVVAAYTTGGGEVLPQTAVSASVLAGACFA